MPKFSFCGWNVPLKSDKKEWYLTFEELRMWCLFKPILWCYSSLWKIPVKDWAAEVHGITPDSISLFGFGTLRPSNSDQTCLLSCYAECSQFRKGYVWNITLLMLQLSFLFFILWAIFNKRSSLCIIHQYTCAVGLWTLACVYWLWWY